MSDPNDSRNGCFLQLSELIDELHQANQKFADAARPLRSLAELNSDQRKKLAEDLRAEMVCWEKITQRIAGVLERD